MIITSKQIIETLSNPTQEELATYLINLLQRWAKDWQNVKQSEFLLIKRNIQDIIYTGTLYRLVALDRRVFDSTNQSDIKRFLGQNKSLLGRYSSWAKTLSGINKELVKQNSIIGSKDQLIVVFQDNLTGISLEKATKFLSDLNKKLNDKNVFIKTNISDLINDFGSSEEILAPFNPSTIRIISVERVGPKFDMEKKSSKTNKFLTEKEVILLSGCFTKSNIDWNQIKSILNKYNLNFNEFYSNMKRYLKELVGKTAKDASYRITLMLPYLYKFDQDNATKYYSDIYSKIYFK